MDQQTPETQQTTGARQKTRWANVIALLVGGVLIGIAVSGLLVVKLMPSMMILTEPVDKSVDETVEALKTAIQSNGWTVSGVRDLNKSLAKEGVDFQPRVMLVELCKPQYAESVLSSDRFIATMMPCTISVWEGDDGKTYLSRMNMPLMARLFGGNIAEVMGKAVAGDEHRILEGILTQ